MIDEIFDPFFTTKKEGKSAELGLAINVIIYHVKGHILLDSQLEIGTTFKFLSKN